MKEFKDAEYYEKLYLPILEENHRKIVSAIKNDIEKVEIFGRPSSSREISEMIIWLEGYIKYFSTFEDLARRLEKNGKPKLYERLKNIISETNEAIKIFNELKIEMVKTEKYIKNEGYKD